MEEVTVDRPSSGKETGACCGYEIVTYPALPLPPDDLHPAPEIELGPGPRIAAVGIGRTGGESVRILSRTLAGVSCSEMRLVPRGAVAPELIDHLAPPDRIDLLFLIVSLEEEGCRSAAEALGVRAAATGIWAVAVASATPSSTGFRDPLWCRPLFLVSARALPIPSQSTVLEGLRSYALRHPVSVLTRLLTLRSGICIDFADIREALAAGRVARVGVGIGSGPEGGEAAAREALWHAMEEGADLSAVAGAVVAIHGSGELTIEAFDEAARVVHESLPEPATLAIGLISEELAGANVRVTAILVSDH